MLPKFTGIEDAYIFVREFEEVCDTMRIHELSEDAIKLRLINFALKENAKKWLYSLPTQSISTWKGFIKIFLRKFFSHHKIAKLRNEITQFCQLGGEPFWKCLDRFKNLLSQCPHHGIETWRLCQTFYEGLNPNSKTMLESMCQGDFMQKPSNEAWQFLEDLAEKSLQWEGTREPENTPARSGMHQISSSIAEEARMASVIRRLEALELKGQTPVNQVNQVSAPICNGCGEPGHVVEECPHLMTQTENGYAQANAAYQRPINNPYAPTYNPGWRNHPNFFWSQGPNAGGPSFTQPNPRPNPTVNPNPSSDNNYEKKVSSLERSLEVLAKTNHDFMQTTSQLLTSNTQAIAHLEMQLSQLANIMSKRERGKLPSQPEANPRTQNNQGP